MIIGMDFLTQTEVSIFPYLRTLVFMERRTTCTVVTVGEHVIDAENLTRLESSIGHDGGWLEECENGLAKYWESLVSG